MKGIIFDIQKFSLHDGPGIRTTVFLKGCNMNCIWCHNPEGIALKPQLLVYRSKCVGCGRCLEICNYDALSLSKGKIKCDWAKCISCSDCVQACPTEALAMAGEWKKVKEVFRVIASDLPYYQKSGGGVTISGGEPTMQAEFCAKLLRRCHRAGIDTAIETNLSMPFEKIEIILPWLSRVFYDIKLMDDQEHKRVTGTSNKMVLKNSLLLDKKAITVIIRTPLIPGITDTDENIRAIAEWVKQLKHVAYIELLNYNFFAMSKYETAGMVYELPSAKPLSKKRMQELATIVRDAGVKVRYSQEQGDESAD